MYSASPTSGQSDASTEIRPRKTPSAELWSLPIKATRLFAGVTARIHHLMDNSKVESTTPANPLRASKATSAVLSSFRKAPNSKLVTVVEDKIDPSKLDVVQNSFPVANVFKLPRCSTAPRQLIQSKFNFNSDSFAATGSTRVERMDSYWNYYSDCDRWKVTFNSPTKTTCGLVIYAEPHRTDVFKFLCNTNLLTSSVIGHLEEMRLPVYQTLKQLEFASIECLPAKLRSFKTDDGKDLY